MRVEDACAHASRISAQALILSSKGDGRSVTLSLPLFQVLMSPGEGVQMPPEGVTAWLDILLC